MAVYGWKKYSLRSEYKAVFDDYVFISPSTSGEHSASDYYIDSSGKFHLSGSQEETWTKYTKIGWYQTFYSYQTWDGKRMRAKDTKNQFSNYEDEEKYGDRYTVYGNGEDTQGEYIVKFTEHINPYSRYSYTGAIGDAYRADLVKSKGSYMEQVTSTSQSAYPKNGKYGNYWYEYIGKISDTRIKEIGEREVMRTSIRIGGVLKMPTLKSNYKESCTISSSYNRKQVA